METKLYTRTDISIILQIPMSTLLHRMQSLRVAPNIVKEGFNVRYFYNETQINQIKDYNLIIPSESIIYVTRTTEVRESKSNFYTDKKISKLLLQY
jgi:hypothetical protein